MLRVLALLFVLLVAVGLVAALVATRGEAAVVDAAPEPPRMPAVALTDAECVPPRGAMLISLAGSMSWTGGVLVFDVLEPLYATRRAGELGVCRDPDPTCRLELGAGSEVRYALTAAVVRRGVLVPGYVVAVRSRGGYARVDRASGTCATAAGVESDACLWVVAGDASGGVFDATRSLLRGVAPFVAAPAQGAQVQPRGIPSAESGTTLATPRCAAVRAGQTECERGGECVFCDALPPAMCEIAALYGACAVYGGVCPVQCALSGARGALEVRVVDPRKARATFVARQPMFKAGAAQRSDQRDPSIAALSTAIRTKRWMFPAMDASVRGEALAEPDRAYFWSVLRAMTARKMPYGVGSAWSESVHGGWAPHVYELTKQVDGWKQLEWRPARPSRIATNRDAEWATADAADLCRRHLVASSEREGEARVRYLSFARMIGECESAASLREWYDATREPSARSPAMTVALGTTLRRFGVGARIARTERGAGLTLEQRVRAVRALGVSEKAARRVAAFESGEYAGLAWADVQEMFGLTEAETKVLKSALSPLSFTIATRAVEWTAMAPRQKIALVERWNAGCTFHFAGGALQMPRGCGARAGAQSHFPETFRYGFWPSDLATREGKTTKHGGSYQCLRCPAGGATTVVQEERVVCKLKEEGGMGSRYDASRREGGAPWEVCDGETHPGWVPGTSYPHRLESGEGDGTYYEDGPDEYFVHYARLDDALTNYADAGGVVRRRDRVRVCKPCPDDAKGWWAPDVATCAGQKRGVFDLGAGNFAFAPYEPYRSDGPPGNPFKAGSARNTELGSVTIAPGFAVYVTPHYHGFHASQRSCHHGLRRMSSEPDAGGSDRRSVHVEQCRVGSWTPQKLQGGAFVDVDAEPLGLVLVNDDLASAWTVERGDVLAVVALDTSGKGSAAAVREHVFPPLVNCLAAWNYCAFPDHWLQRAHTDPASGDKVPELDVVAGPERNNVGATNADVGDFIAHNWKLGALTVFRTQRIFDPPKG